MANDNKRRRFYQIQNGKCLYCDVPLKHWSSGYCCFDHIYAKCLGGGKEDWNMALVCYPCNALKSDYTSLRQVLHTTYRLIRLFLRINRIPKVRRAMEIGARINADGRTKISNPISKVGTPPKQAVQRSLRIEAYEKRKAAFQRIKAASARSIVRSEASEDSSQDS